MAPLALVVQFSVALSNLSGGDAAHDLVRGDIAGDDCSGTDDGPPPDAYPLEDGGTDAYPDVVADGNGEIAPMKVGGIDIVATGDNPYLMRDRHAIADGESATGVNQAAAVDMGMT